MAEHRYNAHTATFPLPVSALWGLLVRAPARGLWQPAVCSAELLIGAEGEAHSEYALNCQSAAMPALVIERIPHALPLQSLRSLKHYPGVDCHSDYTLQPLAAKQCQLRIERTLHSPLPLEERASLLPLLSPVPELKGLKTAADKLLLHL